MTWFEQKDLFHSFLTTVYFLLVYTTQVNRAFGARSLASSEVIIQVYSPPRIKQRAKLQKSIIFQFIIAGKVVIGAIFSNFVVYTKTIIHLGVGESCGYLPP